MKRPSKGQRPGGSGNLDAMQFLDLTLPTAAENVAMDEALVVAAEGGTGGPTLRIWELSERAVVLGASGRMTEDVDVEACRADGVAIARRSSGGGTVLIGPGALNFTVVLAVDADPRLKAVDTTQLYVLERTAEALRALGPDVQVRGSGDLTLNGRKFSGSAQRRLKNFVMVHASLLYNIGAAEIAHYLRTPRRQPEYRAGRSHDEFLTTLPVPRAAISLALRTAWPCEEENTRAPHALAEQLLLDKFGRDDWIGRL
jgi:lipoate-protein ligase A